MRFDKNITGLMSGFFLWTLSISACKDQTEESVPLPRPAQPTADNSFLSSPTAITNVQADLERSSFSSPQNNELLPPVIASAPHAESLPSEIGNVLREPTMQAMDSDAFAGWAANEVPVLIILGQSNTDGRAAYSFSHHPDAKKSRVMVYFGETLAKQDPCSVTATAAAPACAELDLRTTYNKGGKIGEGLNQPDFEFTEPAEKKLIGQILKNETDWNTIQGTPDAGIRMFVPRFAISAKGDKFVLNPTTGAYDTLSEPAFRTANTTGIKGWWEILQPLGVNAMTSPQHLMNSIVGTPYWNGKEIFGPEIGLAVKWRAKILDRPLFLIKFAVGGSSLAAGTEPYKHWSSEPDNLWDPARKLIQTAMSEIHKKGKKPRLIGIYWGQGESDTTAAFSATYAKNLQAFMTRVRTDLKVHNARFFVQQLYETTDASHLTIRKAQSAICAGDGNCTLLSLDEWKATQGKWLKYPNSSEAIHFTAHGQLLIGAKLFNSLPAALSKASLVARP